MMAITSKRDADVFLKAASGFHDGLHQANHRFLGRLV